MPDTLSEEAYLSLSAEPHIKAVLDEVRQARIVVHGIGDAFTMARRRGADAETLERLRQTGAVAEASGTILTATDASCSPCAPSACASKTWPRPIG
nr:sugar-binding domain-containing protein [Calditerricola satsumensis]